MFGQFRIEFFSRSFSRSEMVASETLWNFPHNFRGCLWRCATFIFSEFCGFVFIKHLHDKINFRFWTAFFF